MTSWKSPLTLAIEKAIREANGAKEELKKVIKGKKKPTISTKSGASKPRPRSPGSPDELQIPTKVAPTKAATKTGKKKATVKKPVAKTGKKALAKKGALTRELAALPKSNEALGPYWQKVKKFNPGNQVKYNG